MRERGRWMLAGGGLDLSPQRADGARTPVAVLALSCSKKDQPPPSETAPPSAPAKPAARAVAIDAAAAPAHATKLGPIDLQAAVLDLGALFPGATIELHPAVDAAKAPPGAYTVPTVLVRDGAKTIAEVELGDDHVTAVNGYTLALVPNGIAGGAATAALAAAAPNATCDSMGKGRVWCMDNAEPTIAYVLERGGSDDYSKVPPAKLEDTVRAVRWIPMPDKRPTLAKMPAAAKPARGKPSK